MRSERRTIDCGALKTVSAVFAYPDHWRPGGPTVILAHGAGNDMTNPLLSRVHEGLAAHGFLAVKFNFPYKERGGRAPDPAPVLERCYRAVIDTIRRDPELAPSSLIIGGKSLGGRMASHVAAQGEAVAGLLFLGYPLHPPRKPERLRIAHLAQIRAPMLFLAGTRDALCTLEVLRATLRDLPRATLHVVEGGDHSFNVPKRLGRSPADVIDELIAVSAAWLQQVTRRPMEVSNGR